MNRGYVRSYSKEKAWQQAIAIMKSEGYEFSSHEELSYKRQLIPIKQEIKQEKVLRKEFR